MVEITHQKEYWEKARKRRHPTHPVIKAFTSPKIALIRSVLSPFEKGKIKHWTLLDVGCGNGYFSYYWENFYQTICLDYSRQMLALNPCKKKTCGSAHTLPFENDSFDIVFCSNLLHHLQNPFKAVAEMKRVSRKFVVLSEPNRNNPFMFVFGFIKKEECNSLKFSPKYLKRILEKNKLTLQSFATMGSVLPNKCPSFLLPIINIFDFTNILGFYNVAIGAK